VEHSQPVSDIFLAGSLEIDMSASSGIKEPPKTVRGILGSLGPGLLVAGAIVGSGELIATTVTGAEAGFWLLWLILLGCVIKVFVQVEVARYVIVSGKTSLAALSEIPGPRIGRLNWLVLFWFVMFLFSVGQLGGIVGGVGQALQIAVPLTDAGEGYNQLVEQKTAAQVAVANQSESVSNLDALNAQVSDLKGQVKDHYVWAGVISIITAVFLVIGRYRFIEALATSLVAGFTLMTVINVFLLQSHGEWAIQWADVWRGLSFQLPPKSEGLYPLATALATFGIIGVGAGELVFYPYWCQEKGYARYVGVNDGSEAWYRRAEGWLRVLRWDAFCSMIVYTVSTVAFYLLGAAILHRVGMKPQGMELISTLVIMYRPVFGDWAGTVLLFGSFAVLYSTFFVTNASKARLASDALRVMGFRRDNPESGRWWLVFFSAFFPLSCFLVYACFSKPTQLILAAGFTQALLLPMLSGAALYFRYQRTDSRLAPGKLWDFFLWISALGMLMAGVWLAATRLFPALRELG
jgi:Mn2+/Fe2+ NRAMP family transporter